MSKHTPGEWQYEDADSHLYGKPFAVFADLEGGHREYVCILQNVHYAPERNRPNARLIAAAPDLLESLRGLLVVMSQAIASGDWRVDGACDPDAEVIRARQAIAKATQA